jgi:stalled ribosome rescue protein Dom34
MTLFHAVVHLDHHEAHIHPFDAEHVESTRVKAHRHVTRRHASDVRHEHEFFAEVCDALEGITEVLVAGGHTAGADFERYAHKHRPALAKHLVGHELVDHPTEPQLVALARQWFLKHDRMTGVPTPT